MHRRANPRLLGAQSDANAGGLGGAVYWHVSSLSATQRHILELLGLPPDLYDRLAEAEPNSLPNVRE